MEGFLQKYTFVAVTTIIDTVVSSLRECSVRCTGSSISDISSQIFTTFFSEVGVVSKINKSYGNVYVEFAKEKSVEKVRIW